MEGGQISLFYLKHSLPAYPMVLTHPDKRGRDEQQGPAGCDTATGNRKIAGVLLYIPTLTHVPYRGMCVRSLHGVEAFPNRGREAAAAAAAAGEICDFHGNGRSCHAFPRKPIAGHTLRTCKHGVTKAGRLLASCSSDWCLAACACQQLHGHCIQKLPASNNSPRLSLLLSPPHSLKKNSIYMSRPPPSCPHSQGPIH